MEMVLGAQGAAACLQDEAWEARRAQMRAQQLRARKAATSTTRRENACKRKRTADCDDEGSATASTDDGSGSDGCEASL